MTTVRRTLNLARAAKPPAPPAPKPAAAAAPAPAPVAVTKVKLGKRRRASASGGALPPSAFVRWSRTRKADVRAEHPALDSEAVAQLLGQEWTDGLAANRADLKPYVDEYDASLAKAKRAEMKKLKLAAGGGGDGDASEAKKKKKKKTKMKDLNAPKRPLSSYILFSSAMRASVKAASPELTNTQIVAKLGSMWRADHNGCKALFARTAAEKKQAYEVELKDYKTTENYATYQASLPVLERDAAKVGKKKKKKNTKKTKAKAAQPAAAASAASASAAAPAASAAAASLAAPRALGAIEQIIAKVIAAAKDDAELFNEPIDTYFSDARTGYAAAIDYPLDLVTLARAYSRLGAAEQQAQLELFALDAFAMLRNATIFNDPAFDQGAAMHAAARACAAALAVAYEEIAAPLGVAAPLAEILSGASAQLSACHVTPAFKVGDKASCFYHHQGKRYDVVVVEVSQRSIASVLQVEACVASAAEEEVEASAAPAASASASAAAAVSPVASTAPTRIFAYKVKFAGWPTHDQFVAAGQLLARSDALCRVPHLPSSRARAAGGFAPVDLAPEIVVVAAPAPAPAATVVVGGVTYTRVVKKTKKAVKKKEEEKEAAVEIAMEVEDDVVASVLEIAAAAAALVEDEDQQESMEIDSAIEARKVDPALLMPADVATPTAAVAAAAPAPKAEAAIVPAVPASALLVAKPAAALLLTPSPSTPTAAVAASAPAPEAEAEATVPAVLAPALLVAAALPLALSPSTRSPVEEEAHAAMELVQCDQDAPPKV